MTTLIKDGLMDFEDFENFEDYDVNGELNDFAKVIFAAALDHDGAYGMSGEELKRFLAAKELERTAGTTTPVIASQYKGSTSCLSLIDQFWSKPVAQVKAAPVLNLARSKLFERRAAVAAAKAATVAGTTSPDFVSPYKGKADLHLINQFWRKSASVTFKEAPKLNLTNSKLIQRRRVAEAAKVEAAGGCPP
jgi:hypothetical protein